MYQKNNESDNANSIPPPMEGVNLEVEKEVVKEGGFSLDKPLLWLSNNDFVSYRDGSFFITGSTGAGKSSAAIKTVYKNMLSDGCAAFIAITKATDTEDYIKWTKEAGREEDLVIIGEGGHSLNIIMQEAAATRPLDIPSNLTALAEQIIETSMGGNMEKEFFVLSMLNFFRMACTLLVMVLKEAITLANIDKIINSIALSEEMLSDAAWQSNSYCAMCLVTAMGREADMSEVELEEWKRVQEFFTSSIVNMPEETRESVRATYLAYFSSLLQGSTRQILLADNPTISLEKAFSEGKIVIINAPCKSLGFAAQVLTKIAITFCLKIRERFPVPKDADGNLLAPLLAVIIDEYQLYVSPSAHPTLFSTMRSSGVILVAATQSLSSLYEQLDSRKAKYQANSIINNLPCRLVLNLSDAFTAEEYANDIGRIYTKKMNFSVGRNFAGSQAGGGGNVGSSFHEELLHQVLPLELMSLQKISPKNGYCEAVFYNHGSTFSNGKNHIFLGFSFGESLALEGIEVSAKSSNPLGLFLKEFIGELLRFFLKGLVGGFRLLFRLVSRWSK